MKREKVALKTTLYYILFVIGLSLVLTIAVAMVGVERDKQRDTQITNLTAIVVNLSAKIDDLEINIVSNTQGFSEEIAEVRSEVVANRTDTLERIERILGYLNDMMDVITDTNDEMVGAEERLKLIDDRLIDLENIWDALNFGKFTATAYSPFDNVSGIENDGEPEFTATGSYPTWGTFAVDPEIIPYHSKMIVIGDDFIEHGVALDTGGTMRQFDYWIDLYRDHYWQTLDFGKQDVVVIWGEEN